VWGQAHDLAIYEFTVLFYVLVVIGTALYTVWHAPGIIHWFRGTARCMDTMPDSQTLGDVVRHVDLCSKVLGH
jgi:hypothetical protein